MTYEKIYFVFIPIRFNQNIYSIYDHTYYRFKVKEHPPYPKNSLKCNGNDYPEIVFVDIDTLEIIEKSII